MGLTFIKSTDNALLSDCRFRSNAERSVCYSLELLGILQLVWFVTGQFDFLALLFLE